MPSIRSLLTLSLAAMAMAKEMPKDSLRAATLYDSGLKHQMNIARKQATFSHQRDAGVYASEQYKEIGAKDYVPCKNGKAEAVKGDANNTFRCKNIDLYHFLPHSAFGSTTGEGSSSWGWTAPNGREFIAFGQADGAAFAEITKKGKLVYLGRLPQYSVPAIWREIRAYKNYMVIGSEALGHNIQIFDMRKVCATLSELKRAFANRVCSCSRSTPRTPSSSATTRTSLVSSLACLLAAPTMLLLTRRRTGVMPSELLHATAPAALVLSSLT